MSLLEQEDVLKLIDKHLSDIELEIFPNIDSTNSYLFHQPLDEKIKICIADEQTAGRGRRGKNWYSPAGSNLYMSFAHRLHIEASALSGLSLAVGITLAETLQEYCQDKIQVKWPNDLLVNGKKLSGILVEIKNETDDSYKIITGIGVNVSMPEKAIDMIDQPFISLEQCHPLREISRSRFVAHIIRNVLDAMTEFKNNGFDSFFQKWNQMDAWYGQPVVIKIGKNKILGMHTGIDSTGALLLEQDGEIKRYSSGEVSLRRAC
ncbi:MAG: biotin--[acetyl-CoA-carboxylase] ligase [Gammaproteobacteria bacterium]|nr:biotin--[acetyl-CoA-carboxylase] ligase [Gammaproteobacteria bacterium]